MFSKMITGKKSGLISILCVLAMAMSLASPMLQGVFAADSADCAQIILGEKITCVNAELWNNGSIQKTVRQDGRWGKVSDKEANPRELYFWVNVDDKFMYDLPLYTPVDITVEYFDGEGSFAIDYDSHNPQTYPGVAAESQVWRSTEIVYLTGTNTWKSYTFHLEDMRMTNRCNGAADFRVGVWDPWMGFSKSDVTFGSITVSRSELITPTIVHKISDRAGNIFSDREEIVLTPELENKTKNPVRVSYTYKLKAKDGSVIEESGAPETTELEARERKIIECHVENPEIRDIYDIELNFKYTDTSQPDRIYEESLIESLSISKIFEEDGRDSSFAACQQVVGHLRGEANDTSQLMREVGMTMVRDECYWQNVERQKGVLSIPEDSRKKWQTMHDNGIDIFAILAFENPLYDDGNLPYSDEAIAAYARYCGFMAGELKGLVNHFEIWNEYNMKTVKTGHETPETYAKMAKAAYRAIKEANPEAVVVGICSALIDLEWTERVFKAGGYDYMDVVSVHPYDFSGSLREQKLIKDTEDLKALMRKYGPEKPVWYTEMGFSTYDDPQGYTQEEQAAKISLLKCLCEAYDLCDKLFIYCFYDLANQMDNEACWGLVNKWDDPNNTPSGAKKSFLATAAVTEFTGENAEFKAVLEDERIYAIDFYNTEFNKDVLMLVAGADSGTRNYDLGCRSVTMYDMYGNPMEELHSDTGIYSFEITEVPYYVMGNFSRFKASEQAGPVAVDATIKETVFGDNVTFNFTSNINKPLTIKVEDSQLTVKENNGFADGKAQLVVSLSDSSESMKDFLVTVVDEEGKVYYCQRHRLNIMDPLSISITSERASLIGDSHWRVRAVVTSNSKDQILSGSVRLTAPENAAEASRERTFEGMEPGGNITFLYNLPEQIAKETVNATVSAKVEGGYTVETTELISFDSCVYTGNKPVIDGVNSSGEWIGSWFGTKQARDVKQISYWGGASDLSFSAATMWDEENLYLLAVVTDDVFSVNYPGSGDPAYMWRGDGVQFAMDDREIINPADAESFSEICLGYVPGLGDVVYRSKSLYGEKLPQEGIVEGAQLVVERHDTYTLYEAAVPWSGIFYEGYKLDPSARMGFSMLVNENDFDSRRGWIEYMSGIGFRKDATLFGNMNFLR